MLRGERGRVCSGGRLALRAGVTLCLQAQKSQNSSSVLLQLHHGISRSPSPCPLESHQISEDGAGGPWGLGGVGFLYHLSTPDSPETCNNSIPRGHWSSIRPGHCQVVCGSHPEALQGRTLPAPAPRLPAAPTPFPGCCLSLLAVCPSALPGQGRLSPWGAHTCCICCRFPKPSLKLKNKSSLFADFLPFFPIL